MRRMAKIYALYRGDEFLVVGDIDECAEYMGCSKDRIYSWATPSRHKIAKGKAVVAIRLGEESEWGKQEN